MSTCLRIVEAVTATDEQDAAICCGVVNRAVGAAEAYLAVLAGDRLTCLGSGAVVDGNVCEDGVVVSFIVISLYEIGLACLDSRGLLEVEVSFAV